MATKKFSKGEAVKFGWDVMKKNLAFFIGILAFAVAIRVIAEIVANAIGKAEKNVPLLIFLVLLGIGLWALNVIVYIGIMRITLRFCDNQKAKFADLFSCAPLFFKYLGSAILYGLIVMAGAILLIIPGIIWGIKFQYFGYLIIDKGLGPIEALKKSSVLTKGVKWQLLLFQLLLGAVLFLGAICLLVGLIAAIPTTMVAYAYVYRKLLQQAEAVAAT